MVGARCADAIYKFIHGRMSMEYVWLLVVWLLVVAFKVYIVWIIFVEVVYAKGDDIFSVVVVVDCNGDMFFTELVWLQIDVYNIGAITG